MWLSDCLLLQEHSPSGFIVDETKDKDVLRNRYKEHKGKQ